MRVISVPGRLVRDPVTNRVVDEAGIEVDPGNLYWARLLVDGDVDVAPEDVVARVVDDGGQPIDPPPGDHAADAAAPAPIAPAEER